MEFMKLFAKRLIAGEGTLIEYGIVGAVVAVIVFIIL